MCAVSTRLAAIVIHGAAGRPREEARAVDDVSLAAHDRRDERRELLRIELEVRVLDRDDRADGARRARGESRAPLPAFRSAWITVTGPGSGPARFRLPDPAGPDLPSTSRVPSVEPSLTMRISRATGRSMAQQSIDDGENGANLVVNGNDDREEFAGGNVTVRLGAGVRFGGAGLYSSITLLMIATGRPGSVKLSTPSRRSTASFSPRMLTRCSVSGIWIEIGSDPVGATAFTPPGPAPPPIRSTRSLGLRNSLCTTARESSVLSIVSTPIVAV